jgi:hypothetical protein
LRFGGSNTRRFDVGTNRLQEDHDALFDTVGMIERREPGSRLAAVTEQRAVIWVWHVEDEIL